MLVLASSSPRRRELLSLLGIPFEVVPPAFDELTVKNPGGYDILSELALGKAREVGDVCLGGDIVLGADTAVCLEGRIFGKPSSREEAREMLAALSGKWHEVRTCVAFVSGGREVVETVVSRVLMSELLPDLVEWYLGTGEPFDKAGGYGIQGRGAVLVERLDGDWTNVVGLPMPCVARILRREFGIGPGGACV